MSYNFGDIDRNSKKQRPKCAKCRNHGKVVFRLGHKGCCEFDNCNCDLCRQTKVRNEAMAKTMANERRRKKEADKLSNSGLVGNSSSPYIDRRNRTSFSLHLDTYNASTGGNIANYNARVANASVSYALPVVSQASSCYQIDTKVFSNNTPYGFYNPYKTEVDRAPFTVNSFASVGVTPTHLAMIGTNK